nr:hypothetical protein [Anaerolineae bacterium]
MSRRTRVLGLCGIAVLLVAIAGLARWAAPATPGSVVAAVPPAAQESARAALAQAGYVGASDPVWAAAQAEWRGPGTYRLFFAAPSAQGSSDVFAAQAQVGVDGRVSRLAQATAVTETPAGDEGAPVAAAGWLAFATQVAGRYQSVTCVPLADLAAPQVYVFDHPVDDVALSWQPGLGGGHMTLAVAALQGGEAVSVSVDPAAQRVEPAGAALQCVPPAQGGQAWLPNLVSRVRELPFVGPEKIAFLENVFFTVVDWVNRLRHGAPAAVAQQTAAPTPSPQPATATLQATPAGGTAETATPETTPTVAPTPQGTELADGIVWRGSVEPDPARPFAKVEVVEIDPSLLQIKMVPGTIEPHPSTGLVGSGVIPKGDWGALVAAFNGGFAAMHGQFGMMVDRKVYLPARDGIATLAVYEDGSLRIGTWGRDLTLTPDMVSYRQNCPPLIENGTVTAETGK